MDLRWLLHHVTGTISRAFSLRGGESAIWLFHSSPGSSLEEPMNTHTSRTEQTLKDLQRTAGYLANTTTDTRRPAQITLHAVELPFQLGRDVVDRGNCPFCIRFFDSAVREVGSCIVTVPNAGTVADI